MNNLHSQLEPPEEVGVVLGVIYTHAKIYIYIYAYAYMYMYI